MTLAHCANESCSATLDPEDRHRPDARWRVIDGELFCERCAWSIEEEA